MLLAHRRHPSRPALRAHTRALREPRSTDSGSAPNVTLVTEFLSDDEARTFLVAADVIVLPYEPHGRVRRVRRCASRFRGAASARGQTYIRIFADAADALLQTPSNAPEALADAILDVLRSPGRASQLAAAAQHRAAELSWSSIAEIHLTAYHRLVAARRTPGAGVGAIGS